ncbi:hypothetical protein P3X46_017673 [Hevea brasiliensis]|uniref:Uncharacterized protein n=1 Tax=Hevea brasiliensis TaxID=3981 RepID=A0ABQ9LND4_HEVBR|nr:hypothetical protein P3X46_017673 [Hevea brasiliensis]
MSTPVLSPIEPRITLILSLRLFPGDANMAGVVGNLALFLALASPWPVIQDRKTQPVVVDFVLKLPMRDPQSYATSLADKSFKSDGEARRQRVVARGKANSKVNGVDFDSDEENGNGNGNGVGEEEEFDWENESEGD